MLTLRQITLSRGNKILLQNSSVTLHEKQKIGLVGHNGCGKSTLFGLITGEVAVDQGEISLNNHLRISYLRQQLADSEITALEYVLSGDEEYLKLQQQLLKAEQTGDAGTVAACHDRLNQTGGYSKPAQAATIMAGLGFATADQNKPVNGFSGGWRMRLSLAHCLMKPADLLLLDEPTNHLDMEAIFWLERWLKQSPASIILISHDREFLDSFVNHILHIEQQNITLYSGNYSCFEQTRAQKLALQQQMYEKQQQKISHLMTFVNRFRAKAPKAKQAQSRLNTIAKMDIIAQAQVDSPFSFQFLPCPKANNPLIRCEEVDAGYSTDQIILKRINLVLNPGDRLALLGPNGQGKSTLIKTLTGNLTPLAGNIFRSQNLRVGYYAQHQLEELDNRLSPVQTIQNLAPDTREQAIRDFLGGFNFVGDMAMQPITHFSGGEKARLALAKLVWLKPNLLLLDEPTNHLDLAMRAAIEIALQSYEGALILISHDRHLLRSSVDDFYLVYQQQVQSFKGDLSDYYTWLQEKETQANSQSTASITQYRERKSLQNRLKKLEQLVEQCQQQLQQFEHNLSDDELYTPSQQQQLQQLLDGQQRCRKTLADAEEEWLEVMGLLEKTEL